MSSCLPYTISFQQNSLTIKTALKQPLFFIVEFFVHFTELLVGNVSVYLRGGDARMTKHSLYTANVCAVAQ